MTESLLPPSSTPLERAVEQTMARFAPLAIVPTLWNAATCPVAVLPWLAWALSVDNWDPAWTEETKRTAIAEAETIHRRKGTLDAVERALAVHGHPDAVIVERSDYIRHDGQATRNGIYRRGGPSRWATYKIFLQRPATAAEVQAIETMLATVARNCCHLVAIVAPAA